jgi:hypothetical protein
MSNPFKKKQPKAKGVDVKNLKKVVNKIEGLATSKDIDKLREELIMERRRNKFANLPPRLKLRVLRSLSKDKK